MATSEEIFALVMKVQGEAELKKLREEIRRDEDAILALDAALGKNRINAAAHAQQVMNLGASLAANAKRVKEVEARLMRAGGAAGNAAYKMQMFGQTLDDLQYVGEQGLRPIINNVMALDARLGILLLAGDLLYRNWNKVFDSGPAKRLGTEIDQIKARLKELGDNPAKLSSEYREAEILEGRMRRQAAGQAAYESLTGRQTDQEKTAGEEAADAVLRAAGGRRAIDVAMENSAQAEADRTELPAKRQKILDDLTKSLKSYEAHPETAPDDIKSLYEARKQVADELDKLKGAAAEDARNRFKAILGRVTGGQGDDQQRSIKELAEALKKSGASDVARAIEEAPGRAHQRNEDELDRTIIRGNKAQATEKVNRQIGDVLDDAFREALKGGATPENARESLKPIIREYIKRNLPFLAESGREADLEEAVNGLAHDSAKGGEAKVGRQAAAKAQAAFGQAAKEVYEKALTDKGADAATAELTAYLQKKAEDAYPELKEFPDQMRKLVNGMRDQVKASVDAGLDAMMALGMTRAEAERHLQVQATEREAARKEAVEADDPARVRHRLAEREAARREQADEHDEGRFQQRTAEREEARQGRLADDEFTKLAKAQAKQAQALNPLMRPPSARELREQGEAMRQQAAGMGLNEQEQARFARLMQDPNNRRIAGAIFNQMGGADPRQNALMAMEAMESGDIRGTLNRGQRRSRAAQNAAIRAQMREENEMMRAMMGLGRRVRRRTPNDPGLHSVGVQGPGVPNAQAEQDAKRLVDDSKQTVDLLGKAVTKLESIDERLASGVPTVLS
jgi:hypothetical protein